MTSFPGSNGSTVLPNGKTTGNGKNGDPLPKSEFRWGVIIMTLLMAFIVLEAAFGFTNKEIPKALNDLVFLVTGSFLSLLYKMLES